MKTITMIVLAAVVFGGFGFVMNNIANGGMITVTEVITPTVEEPTTPGGSSGGAGGGSSVSVPSGSITLPELNQRTTLNYSEEGLYVHVSGETESGWWHETSYGSHWHNKKADGRLEVRLNQDEFTHLGNPMYAFPYSAHVNVNSYVDDYVDGENVTIFRGTGEMRFLFTTDIDEITDWREPTSSSYHSDRDGKRVYASISISHDRDWVPPMGEDKDGGDWIDTDDIYGRMNFELEDGEMRDIEMGVSDYIWWTWNEETDDEEITIIGLTIRAEFSAAYMPDVPAAQNPEPATMTLLAIGGLAVLKRRRRYSQRS